MSARALRRSFRVSFVAGVVGVILLLAGPANAFFWCWPMVAIVGGPRQGSTITTDTVDFRLVVTRPPSDVKALVCTLAGPTSATGCDPLVRDGRRSRSLSGMTAGNLQDGKYLFTVKVVNRWGWVTDVDRRWFKVDLPDDRARCSVENSATGGTFASDDGQALTQALASSASGEELRIEGSCSGNFVLDHDVSLVGAGAGATLDGLGSGTVLTVGQDVTAEVRDVTVTGGGESGIVSQGALTISGASTITGNQRSMVDPDFAFAHGGGILNDEGVLVLRDQASVTGNSVTASGSEFDIAFGGGIFSTGDVSISGSVTISGNTASTPDGGSAAGGGLYNESAEFSIAGATISGNTASSGGGEPSDARGGGIYTVGVMTITDSTLTGNQATATGPANGLALGGAIFKGDGTLDLAGSTAVTSNTATASGTASVGQGGGLYADNRDGSLQLLGAVAITGNAVSTESASGGGLFTRGAAALTVVWSGTVAGNSPDDCARTRR
jgi:hypothetical protein